MGFGDRCHAEMGETWILLAVKWELSLAASKMGETWSDGGPPFIRPRPALLLVTVHMRLQQCSRVCDQQNKPLTSPLQISHCTSAGRSVLGYQLPYCRCGYSGDTMEKTSPDAAVGCG